MSKRYIDADKLAKGIKLSIKSWGRDCNSNAPRMVTAYQDVLYRVEAARAADVAEVRHEHWTKHIVTTRGYGVAYYQHKECEADGGELFKSPHLYCPNCGAKMDGERREK